MSDSAPIILIGWTESTTAGTAGNRRMPGVTEVRPLGVDHAFRHGEVVTLCGEPVLVPSDHWWDDDTIHQRCAACTSARDAQD